MQTWHGYYTKASYAFENKVESCSLWFGTPLSETIVASDNCYCYDMHSSSQKIASLIMLHQLLFFAGVTVSFFMSLYHSAVS